MFRDLYNIKKLQTEFINDYYYYLTVVVKEYYRNMRVCISARKILFEQSALGKSLTRVILGLLSLTLSPRIPPAYPRRRRFGDHGSTCYFVFDNHARNWTRNNKYRPRR